MGEWKERSSRHFLRKMLDYGDLEVPERVRKPREMVEEEWVEAVAASAASALASRSTSDLAKVCHAGQCCCTVAILFDP